MTVFFLVVCIILLVAYLIYLAQRKDQLLLRSPPIPEKLPNIKYNQLLREFNLLRDQPMPASKRARSARLAEIYYLKEKLDGVARQTEEEQRAYNIACKEMEIAWQDYYDYFNSLTTIDRLLSLPKISDLRRLRSLFLEAQARVAIEKEKIIARGRVKIREDQLIQEREAEIERKSAVAPLSIDEPFETTAAVFSDNFNDNSSRNPSSQGSAIIDISPDSKEDINSFDSRESVRISGNLDPAIEIPISPLEKEGHFGQVDFLDRYPDFINCSYIDESLSLEELEMPVVRDATFENAFFVSVVFKGIHQYQACSFTNTDFSQSIWPQADSPHRMLNCSFIGSHFVGASFEYFAFYNCRFVETSFANARFDKVKFVNCSLDNCNIEGVDFSKTVMSLDMLEQIDFTSCQHPPKNRIETTSQFEKKTDIEPDESEAAPLEDDE